MSALGNSATGERARERYDVAVVGAGQAGLAIGYYLARQGRRFVVLEGCAREVRTPVRPLEEKKGY